MNYDAKSCLAQILTMQDAKSELLDHLRAHGGEGILKDRPIDQGARTHGDGGGGKAGKWRRRPCAQFFCIRGAEHAGTVMICARKSLVQGVRLLVFQRRNDGEYRKPGNGRKAATNTMARSRLLVVGCKIMYSHLHGGGDPHGGGDDQELRVMTMHVHCATAKKDISNGGEALKRLV